MLGQPQLLLLIADISELKSSELAAKDNHDFIELLINTVPSPLFYKAISGAYLGCNDAFVAFFGKPLTEIVGNKAWSLLPPDAAALVETKDEELIANGVPHHYETQICRADGVLRDVEYHKAVYRNTGCEPLGIVGVMLDITERKLAEALLRELATIDALTGLSNRRHFDELFAIEWNRAQRTGAVVSLLMVDVDNFKLYNDHYGHQRGDECLSRVASAIRGACLRPSDFVARYGGEEFAVILPDVPCGGAMVVAERIRLAVLALEIDHSVVGCGPLVTISVGVAEDRPTRDTAPSQLLQSADKALYNAKHAGKNRVVVG